MTGPRFIGWTGGRDSNDRNGARLYECDTTGPTTCRTLRPLPPGRAYQERAAQWVRSGPWQVRGLTIEGGWTL